MGKTRPSFSTSRPKSPSLPRNLSRNDNQSNKLWRRLLAEGRRRMRTSRCLTPTNIRGANHNQSMNVKEMRRITKKRPESRRIRCSSVCRQWAILSSRLRSRLLRLVLWKHFKAKKAHCKVKQLLSVMWKYTKLIARLKASNNVVSEADARLTLKCTRSKQSLRLRT